MQISPFQNLFVCNTVRPLNSDDIPQMPEILSWQTTGVPFGEGIYLRARGEIWIMWESRQGRTTAVYSVHLAFFLVSLVLRLLHSQSRYRPKAAQVEQIRVTSSLFETCNHLRRCCRDTQSSQRSKTVRHSAKGSVRCTAFQRPGREGPWSFGH